jgi:DNA-binding NarL/FixJ family response regulator
MIRVLVCDDHPVVRAGIGAMLAGRDGFTVVGEAADGAEAVALATELRPDVVLMDLRMPGTDGVAATAEIVARHPEVRVVVLTTYDTDADILRAVAAGAKGYLLKDAPREDLYAAVQDAAAGRSAIAPAVAGRLLDQLRQPAGTSLTEREIQVLDLVRHGRSNREIGQRLHITDATVKTHLLHVFTKLGVDDRTAAVHVALQRGLLRLDAPPRP